MTGPGSKSLRSCRRRPAVAIAGAVLAAVCSLVMPPAQAGAAPASPLPSTGRVLNNFSPIYMGSHLTMTASEAVTIAQTYDVVAAQPKLFTPYLAAMRAANPAFRVVAYMNGTFDQSAGGTGYPLAWYATTSSGARIRSRMFGNYLMTPSNSSWQQSAGQRCAALIAASGYDGCFLDTMGTAPLGAGYVTGLPYDKATSAVWTGPDWLAATTAEGAAVQAANPGALVVLNGISSGGKYFSNGGATSALLDASGVAMAEICLRIPTQPATLYPSQAKWQEDVDMLAQAESRGQSVLSVTKLWTTATPAQQAAWHKFALSTFLLGAGGHSYFSFLQDTTDSAFVAENPWDHVNIGAPLGAYTQAGGLYQRAFTNGVVAVNPTSAPLTLTLATPLTNLDGAVVSSETLAPDAGDVLIAG